MLVGDANIIFFQQNPLTSVFIFNFFKKIIYVWDTPFFRLNLVALQFMSDWSPIYGRLGCNLWQITDQFAANCKATRFQSFSGQSHNASFETGQTRTSSAYLLKKKQDHQNVFTLQYE